MTTQGMVRAVALRAPDREALVCRDARVTYGELDRGTNRIASMLRERGVGAGDRVVLLADNGVSWPRIYLAVLKLGASVVPVDPHATVAEVAAVIADAAPRLVVVADRLRPLAEEAVGGRAVTVETVAGLCQAADLGSAEVLPDPGEADADALGTRGDNALREGDRILIALPFAQPAALAHLRSALTIGATLVIMPRFDDAEISATIVRERISVVGVRRLQPSTGGAGSTRYDR